jgi:hypothetical protein
MNRRDIYRMFYLTAAAGTFFSLKHRTFSRIDHMLDYKTSFSKLKKIEIISFNFFDYNTLEINNKHNRKHKNM